MILENEILTGYSRLYYQTLGDMFKNFKCENPDCDIMINKGDVFINSYPKHIHRVNYFGTKEHYRLCRDCGEQVNKEKNIPIDEY